MTQLFRVCKQCLLKDDSCFELDLLRSTTMKQFSLFQSSPSILLPFFFPLPSPSLSTKQPSSPPPLPSSPLPPAHNSALQLNTVCNDLSPEISTLVACSLGFQDIENGL